MAAPTAVTVEAYGMASTYLRWTYSGSSVISVWRSTDGAAYSEVTATGVSRVEPGTTVYNDVTGLNAGTKYWYKLSDDGGSTYSSVVTVYTHFCADQNAGQAFQLPRFDEGQTDTSYKLNELAERVERAIGDNVLNPGACVVCPVDGAVVIDCTDGCNSFVVVADQDINSFSINRCGHSEPFIDLYVPPSTTVGVCGLPAGYGFDGNECTEAPLSGGDNGRTIRIGTGGPAGGAGGGGGSTPGLPKTLTSSDGASGSGGGTGCECIPGKNNQLTIKCCTANCSLDCSSGKVLLIKICGGVSPYTVTRTGSITFNSSGATTVTTGKTISPPVIQVRPPTNTGSGVAGTAYRIGKWHRCDGGWNAMDTVSYGCDDSVTVACAKSLANSALHDSDGPCPGGSCCSFCGDGGAACTADQATAVASQTHTSEYTGATCYLSRPCDIAGGTVCDARTATQISGGCSPCGLNQGAVVTVTDASGVAVSITVRA